MSLFLPQDVAGFPREISNLVRFHRMFNARNVHINILIIYIYMYKIIYIYIYLFIYIIHAIIRPNIRAQPNSAILTKHGRVQYFIY